VNPTTQSDIYSLAMVIIEVIHQFYAHSVQTLKWSPWYFKVFTGKIPFPKSTNVRVVIMISKGERPPRPPGSESLGLGSMVWKLTEECWNQSPEKRPDATSALQRFQAIVDIGLWSVEQCW